MEITNKYTFVISTDGTCTDIPFEFLTTDFAMDTDTTFDVIFTDE